MFTFRNFDVSAMMRLIMIRTKIVSKTSVAHPRY